LEETSEVTTNNCADDELSSVDSSVEEQTWDEIVLMSRCDYLASNSKKPMKVIDWQKCLEERLRVWDSARSKEELLAESSDDEEEKQSLEEATRVAMEILEERKRVWNVVAHNSTNEELLEMIASAKDKATLRNGSLSAQKLKVFEDVRCARVAANETPPDIVTSVSANISTNEELLAESSSDVVADGNIEKQICGTDGQNLLEGKMRDGKKILAKRSVESLELCIGIMDGTNPNDGPILSALKRKFCDDARCVIMEKKLAVNKCETDIETY
jgi:hypothetical protein